MTTKAVTVHPDTHVRAIANLLLKYRISAVPVVDADKHIVGIVSEGDLMRRTENDTEHRPSSWLEAVFAKQKDAGNYIKFHGRMAENVMTRKVVTITKDTPLHEIARLLEKHKIKRVPVTLNGRLIGIVSRANLLQGLAAKASESTDAISSDDNTIREKLLIELYEEVRLDRVLINVIVNDGVVQLWGIVDRETEKQAAQVAAENVPGVRAVENYLSRVPPCTTAE